MMKKSILKRLIKEIITTSRWDTPKGTPDTVINVMHIIIASLQKRNIENPTDYVKIGKLKMSKPSDLGWSIFSSKGNERNYIYYVNTNNTWYISTVSKNKIGFKIRNAKNLGDVFLHSIMEDWVNFTERGIDNLISEDFTLGYSHGIVIDDPIFLVRDPLNDPELTGKMNEQYRFHDFDWLSDMSGFGKPTDVYYGSILLGVIESKPDGYIIRIVMGPKRAELIRSSPKNKFKTKEVAAKVLHATWKQFRNINI